MMFVVITSAPNHAQQPGGSVAVAIVASLRAGSVSLGR
jgi:hypothetical protein